MWIVTTCATIVALRALNGCGGAARRAPRNTCNTRGYRWPSYPRFGFAHNRYRLRSVTAKMTSLIFVIGMK
jgi:hypothetical protein